MVVAEKLRHAVYHETPVEAAKTNSAITASFGVAELRLALRELIDASLSARTGLPVCRSLAGAIA